MELKDETCLKINFLVDTGATISLIKKGSIPKEARIHHDILADLKGIDKVDNPTRTLGYVDLEFVNNLKFTLHVVNDDFPIGANGIIGGDILNKYKGMIDYNTKILKLEENEFKLHYENEIEGNNLNKECMELTITVKARTESVIPIKITNDVKNNHGIVPRKELVSGVVLCPSLITVNDNKGITTVLNTTNEDITLPIPQVKLEEVDLVSEKILKINDTNEKKNYTNENYESSRLDKLENSLRTNHLNSEEKLSLINLCKEYNHIFHLEGDKLSCTDIVMHEIHTKNEAPINTKSYRYPEALKGEVNKQINKMLKDDVIKPSHSPWNSPIWVVPKKLDASGEKKWRVVVDYRKLNEVSIGDSYPLPQITEILDQLGHSKYFTTLDLASGFHQIKMHPKDAPKTAFTVPQGHFEYNRMPFGLKNAPATFQRLMNSVLTGLQGNRCFVYLDDVVIHADNLENHNRKLKEVFERFSNCNLKLQPDKCEFLKREVMYLGHLITENGVKPDPNKISAIENFPIPKNCKDIKGFLGLAGYYRRFIPNFSSLSQPLTKLLKKDVPFHWTSLQQHAFEILKKKLCESPILIYPDFNQPFNLTTDASNHAIGGILSQGPIGQDLPIAYASRTLNKAEQNYSTTERELLAIIWCVKHFRPYLYGRKFNMITDHQPLTYLFNSKNDGARIFRWRLSLEEYEFTPIYKPGKLNTNADALSRITPNIEENVLLTKPSETVENYKSFLEAINKSIIINNNIKEIDDELNSKKKNILIAMSADKQIYDKGLSELANDHNHLDKINDLKTNEFVVLKEKDSAFIYICTKDNHWDKTNYEVYFNLLQNVKEYLLKEKEDELHLTRLGDRYDNLNYKKSRLMLRFIFRKTNIKINIYNNSLITPSPNEIDNILKEMHCTPTGGHAGFHKCYKRIKSIYKWKGMKNNIKDFIARCEACQQNKLIRKKHREPMIITSTANDAFEKISLDIVGPFPLTMNGNKYILTLQDDLTKYSQAYALPDHTAETIAKVFVKEFVCKFGIPKSILTDQGADFTSKLLTEVSKLFKIKRLTTTAYHPQTNGSLERSHATLAEYLRHFIREDQNDWDNWIDFAMFSYNTAVHTSTKFTPHELLFGSKPSLPSSITAQPEFKYSYDDYIDDLTLKLRKSREIAKNNLIDSKIKNKEYYDRKCRIEKYQIGNKVYVSNESNKIGKSKKLSPQFTGPYEIIEINSPVNVTVLMKRRKVKIHVNRLKLAK